MPFNSNVAVPLALGLSLVSVTAFVIYYIFKDEDDNKEKDSNVKTSRVNVIEVTVPKSIVPALIGRSGSNIKDIEKKTGALIHFKKFSDKEYDVCILRGRSEATQLAETLIHEFINDQPDIVEDIVNIPNWACGRIIGVGGEHIKEISHRSGARVKLEGLPSHDNTAVRTVTIKGTTDQIRVAKELIEKCVAQEKCRREIEACKRSPRHVAPSSPPRQPVAVAEPAEPAEPAAPAAESSGASIEVYVSAVSSPSRFWVQLAGPQVAQLDQLVDQMTEYYSNKDNRDAHLLKHVSIGQVVAAVFRHDGRWYRARVVDIKPNEFDASKQVADVFFVDYGDSEYVGTHELCELRADLLRLRFQAMECFLAGVRPAGSEADVVRVTETGQRWDKWTHNAIERFEQLTQVARWKSLVSRTCTYKKAAAGDGDKDKEIPGIKLYDVTEEGELDIGNVLLCEGLAVPAPSSPRPSPPRVSPPPKHTPAPFGDLGSSMVLGILTEESTVQRCSSLPKDMTEEAHTTGTAASKDDKMTTSKSMGSGLYSADRIHHDPSQLSNPVALNVNVKPNVNGSQEDFLRAERNGTREPNTPLHHMSQTDMFKANMNRIDSHHGSLESLARQHEVHK